MQIKFAKVHTPVFVAGTNLGTELDVRRRYGMELVFDKKDQILLIKYKKEEGIVPLANVAVMIALGEEKLPEPAVMSVPKPKGKAQVSTPHDHVFQGVGYGKVGDTKI